MRIVFLTLVGVATLCAQPLRVFSEFVRFDAAGDPVSPPQPREILSPAIVRIGFTSFQISIQVPSDTKWTLYVGQNPDDAVKVTLYRIAGEKLERIEEPTQGQGPQLIWMDLWTDRAAPVRRIKVEPQLQLGSDWVIYPMEGRVMDAIVPDDPKPKTPLCPKVAFDGLRLRSALQDAALSTRAPKED